MPCLLAHFVLEFGHEWAREANCAMLTLHIGIPRKDGQALKAILYLPLSSVGIKTHFLLESFILSPQQADLRQLLIL